MRAFRLRLFYCMLKLWAIWSWANRLVRGWFRKTVPVVNNIDDLLQQYERFTWTADSKNLGYAKHPYQFYLEGRGDCEDFAHYAVAAGRAGLWKQTSEIVPIGVLYAFWKGEPEGHAVALFAGENCELWIMDQRYKPAIRYGGRKYFLNAAEAISGSKKLEFWCILSPGMWRTIAWGTKRQEY